MSRDKAIEQVAHALAGNMLNEAVQLGSSTISRTEIFNLAVSLQEQLNSQTGELEKLRKLLEGAMEYTDHYMLAGWIAKDSAELLPSAPKEKANG